MKKKPRASRRSLVEMDRQKGRSAGSSRPPEFPRTRALSSLERLERRIRSGTDRSQPGGQGVEESPRRSRLVRVYDGGEPVKRSPGRTSSAASLPRGGPGGWDPLPAMAGTAGAGAFEVEAFEHVPLQPAGPSEAPSPPAPVMDPPTPPPSPSGGVMTPAAVASGEGPSEEEIQSDLEALTGRKPPPEPAEPRERPRPIISTDGGGSDTAGGDEEAAPPSTQQGRTDPHSIFDRMAENLRYAATFDLGSVALERRLDAFERELELEESRAAASRVPVSLELDDLEMAEDLSFLGIGPPEATESDSPPGPSPQDQPTEEANRPASSLPDPGEDDLARAEGKEP